MIIKEEKGGIKFGIWNEQIHTTVYKIYNQEGPTV